MTDSVQEQLLGHLLGALDDSEEEFVQAQLQRDPQLRQELEEASRLLEPIDQAREAFTPPPGLAEETCRLVLS